MLNLVDGNLHLAPTPTPLAPQLPMSTETSPEALHEYMLNLVGGALSTLEEAGCITLGMGDYDDVDDSSVAPTTAGRVASFYYLDCATMALFSSSLKADMGLGEVLQVRDGQFRMACPHARSHTPTPHYMPVQHMSGSLGVTTATRSTPLAPRLPPHRHLTPPPHTVASHFHPTPPTLPGAVLRRRVRRAAGASQ